MYCGLQNDDGTGLNFIPCDECMMNVKGNPLKCSYYFSSERDFDKHFELTGKDYRSSN